MPFKSEKQRRYLYANQPKLAKKWSNMYGDKIIGLGNMSAEDILDRAFSQVYKQGYKDREDESLGMRRGAEKGKKQSYKDRRNESYGKFGKRDKEKKGKNKINKKISGLGGLSTDEYLMRIAGKLLADGLSPSKFTKRKAKALTKDVVAAKMVHKLIDKYPADIVIYMKRIKNL